MASMRCDLFPEATDSIPDAFRQKTGCGRRHRVRNVPVLGEAGGNCVERNEIHAVHLPNEEVEGSSSKINHHQEDHHVTTYITHVGIHTLNHKQNRAEPPRHNHESQRADDEEDIKSTNFYHAEHRYHVRNLSGTSVSETKQTVQQLHRIYKIKGTTANTHAVSLGGEGFVRSSCGGASSSSSSSSSTSKITGPRSNNNMSPVAPPCSLSRALEEPCSQKSGSAKEKDQDDVLVHSSPQHAGQLYPGVDIGYHEKLRRSPSKETGAPTALGGSLQLPLRERKILPGVVDMPHVSRHATDVDRTTSDTVDDEQFTSSGGGAGHFHQPRMVNNISRERSTGPASPSCFDEDFLRLDDFSDEEESASSCSTTVTLNTSCSREIFTPAGTRTTGTTSCLGDDGTSTTNNNPYFCHDFDVAFPDSSDFPVSSDEADTDETNRTAAPGANDRRSSVLKRRRPNKLRNYMQKNSCKVQQVALSYSPSSSEWSTMSPKKEVDEKQLLPRALTEATDSTRCSSKIEGEIDALIREYEDSEGIDFDRRYLVEEEAARAGRGARPRPVSDDGTRTSAVVPACAATANTTSTTRPCRSPPPPTATTSRSCSTNTSSTRINKLVTPRSRTQVEPFHDLRCELVLCFIQFSNFIFMQALKMSDEVISSIYPLFLAVSQNLMKLVIFPDFLLPLGKCKREMVEIKRPQSSSTARRRSGGSSLQPPHEKMSSSSSRSEGADFDKGPLLAEWITPRSKEVRVPSRKGPASSSSPCAALFSAEKGSAGSTTSTPVQHHVSNPDEIEQQLQLHHEKINNDELVFLYLHGGSYLLMHPAMNRFFTHKLAVNMNAKVFAPYYRKPFDNFFHRVFCVEAILHFFHYFYVTIAAVFLVTWEVFVCSEETLATRVRKINVGGAGGRNDTTTVVSFFERREI
ncbi:unnamed protein product [Amoebophrya sp. A120]|nr:unnamed protein product [Amoebophrya sp. A120]|eukprot:GSA120T00017252001.1